jgi:hypothetical protein
MTRLGGSVQPSGQTAAKPAAGKLDPRRPGVMIGAGRRRRCRWRAGEITARIGECGADGSRSAPET